MSGTASTPAAAGAGTARAAVRASSPTATTALGYGASPVHVYLPASADSSYPRGTVYRGKAESNSPFDSRPPLELISPATSEGTHTLAAALTGPGSVTTPATVTGATSGTSAKKTTAAGAVVQQHRVGPPFANRGSSLVTGGNGSYSPSWGGTWHLDVPPRASTELKDTIQLLQSQQQAPTSAAAVPAAPGKKEGAGATSYLQRSTLQFKQQQRRGLGGVYARREKIHNLTMQALQQRKGPATVSEVQRQQQRSLLQEHLPAFFPTASEGEDSEDAKKLHRVLAFQHPAAITAAAEAASEKNGEPLDWRKATVAMAAFGLPQDAKNMLKDDDRWKRAFSRASLAARCPLPADSQFFLFMALVAEGSRRYEEAEAYVLRMLVANAIRKEETPAKQCTCVQKVISRRLRHQRNLWKQTIALEQALKTRQSAVEDRLLSGARLEKTVELDEVLSYKQRLKAEIVRHCFGVIWTATHLLKPFAVSVAGRMFVHKTIAAAYRQATQYTVSVSQFQCLEMARDNYEIAVELAKSNGNLELCDVARLEVFISWVNFLFYNLKEHKLALQEGRRTLQEALRVLPTIKEEKKFDEAVEALQTLMRSIRRWMQETQKDAVFDWWMG